MRCGFPYFQCIHVVSISLVAFRFVMWTKRGQKPKQNEKRTPKPRFGSSEKSGESLYFTDYLLASSIATATATVIPTMGLLPAPIKPIIST